jgi:hypothetical protein
MVGVRQTSEETGELKVRKARSESLEPTFQKLMEMEPVRAEKLPQSMPKRGIYLLSDGDIHF